jgi:glucosylglycerate synthase
MFQLSPHDPASPSLESFQNCDILIGLPSRNHETSIGHILRAARDCLNQYFPASRCVILHLDCGATDHTVNWARAACPNSFYSCYHFRQPLAHQAFSVNTLPEDFASAWRCLIQKAAELEAKKILLLRPDSIEASPERIRDLLLPLEQAQLDYVAPVYSLHYHEGILTSHLLYPLLRSLFGKRLQTPVDGNFSFSSRMAREWMKKGMGEPTYSQISLNLWLTTTALATGHSVGQTNFGRRLPRISSEFMALPELLVKTLTPLFNVMENCPPIWMEVKGSTPVPMTGGKTDWYYEPGSTNPQQNFSAFQQAFPPMEEIWRRILPTELLDQIRELSQTTWEAFNFQDHLWVNIIFEWAVAYVWRRMERSHLIRSFAPLFLGRSASFIRETEQYSSAELGNRLELLCLEFENLKPILINRWRP